MKSIVWVTVVATVTLHYSMATSDFGILKNDSIFDGGTQGNKAFLKTRLLENLNNFFPSINNEERLEMLTGSKSSSMEEKEDLEDARNQQELTGNSITEAPPSDYPTLIPFTTASDPEKELHLAAAPSSKVRSEGRITSEVKLDSIRDWRKRLYKAFKNRSKISRIIRKSPSEEVVEMNDISPTIMDKNRQIILSRTEPNWQSLSPGKHIQTYGRDPNGKLIPLFGLEPAPIYEERSEQKVIEPYPPREIRYAYRTSNRQPVVYVPAAPQTQNTIPVPVASYLVTANPSPQPIQLHILPPMPTASAPSPLQPQIIYQQTTQAPQLFSYSTFAPTSSIENQNINDCSNGQCRPESDDDKCNSQRLRTIIFNNIVSGDAESSKRAVQSAAEAETGLFFDAICGTGFFSYIAHTDEFCLASSGGVNCYVFAPVCQGTEEQRKKKSKLSKN
ncbi:CRE-GRL-14 protein [Caenorhabditis remanei]|uniref:CRE-GRL-14 protein n=1 Tax=Caenorhabditis remanei TaxID=31234 RepID=E3MEY7_CAERE|nr:CRE-GRL-14 protein [Caenorhabditis remanei]